MSSFVLPGAVTVAAMSSADREAFVRSLDRERRRVEAQVALFVHSVGQVGGHLDDRHRTAKAGVRRRATGRARRLAGS